MTVLLAALAGAAFGFVLTRGAFCFHSTWRGVLTRPPALDLVRAYVLLLLVATPVVQVLRALDVIDPYVAPLAWRADLLGGALFGVGMVVASSCVTGLFYKLGEGMLGAAAGLAAWAAGDVVTYAGPLSEWRERLNADPVTRDGQAPTLTGTDAFGVAAVAVLAVVAILAGWWLARSRRTPRAPHWAWPKLGALGAVVLAAAWLLAAGAGTDYPFGTSGVPTRAWDALVHGETAGSWWIPIALVSLVPGAVFAARRAGTTWVRGETPRRYGQLVAGGFVMGVGAAVAGGCNLGHATVGVPLLSAGSIVATLAMIGGVAAADRIARSAIAAGL